MVEDFTCPVCGKHHIGRIGVDQYYCWDCFVEYMVKAGKVEVFNIEDDGSLTDFYNPPEVIGTE